MKMADLGEVGAIVRKKVDAALRDWPQRGGKRVRIVDVQQDMKTDDGGTLSIRIRTCQKQFWNVRIHNETFIDAIPC